MDNEIKTQLYDILNAINEIERFFDDTTKDFEVYRQEDPEVKHAVETHIETIGDAINELLEKDSNIQLSTAKKIIDTEYRIHNAHNDVSDEMIWSIVINYLPSLKAEVTTLLNT